jgi:dienelactone hydrolase
MKQRLMREAISLGLGLASVLVAAGAPQPLPAQDTTFRRLTVRPKQMATGTRTEKAGEQQLELPVTLRGQRTYAPNIYVPQQCVGTRRCPLVVFVWPEWPEFKRWVFPMADRYGMILLGPGSGYFRLTRQRSAADSLANLELQHLDAAMKYVLANFAIDPDKIAIMGTCATGSAPTRIGGDNYEVFNRIISLSPGAPAIGDVDPPNPKVEYFLDAGFLESRGNFAAAQKLREQGHRVTHAVGLRWHGHQLESYDHVGYWLQETWKASDPAARPAAKVLSDPLPELTSDILTKMTTFWKDFVFQSDSIRMTARQALLREVVVPVGKDRPLVYLVDMAVLASKYPTVDAALKTAGLTPQQHDVYRTAIISAVVTKNIGATEAVESTSPIAKNVAFMNEHPDEFQALAKAVNGSARPPYPPSQVPANMWHMP